MKQITKASGRGVCADCGAPIHKGTKQLLIEKGGPYYSSNRYCKLCGIELLQVSIERNKILLKKLKER